MASNEFNLINELPNNLYVKMTSYLSVNDIENLKRSGIDERTEMAFANLDHAVTYLYDLIDFEGRFVSEDLMQSVRSSITRQLSKLPSSLKSLKLYGLKRLRYKDLFPNGSKDIIAEHFPCLECFHISSDLGDSDTYIDRLRNNKLKTIRTRDATLRALSKSTFLRKLSYRRRLTFENDGLLLSTLRQLHVLSFEMMYRGEDGPIRKVLTKLRDSLKIIKINDHHPVTDAAFLNEFIDFCTTFSFKTILDTHSDRLESLKSTNLNLIYSLSMTDFNEKVKSLPMLEKLSLVYGPETYELFETLAELRTINSQLKKIKLSCYRDVSRFVPLGKFLVTHSNLVHVIKLQIHDNAKVFISILAMVKLRLKRATLFVHDQPTNELYFDDIKSLYSVSVRELFSIYTSSANLTVFKEAKPKIIDRKCVINVILFSNIR